MPQQAPPIICLASWYPNELDPFEGDFIQRKLLALSQYKEIVVLHVKKHEDTSFDKKENVRTNGNLTEHLYYEQVKNLSAFKFYKRFFQIHNQFLKNYIAQHGKPESILVQVPYNAGIVAWYWKKRYGIEYLLTEHYGIYNEHYELNFKTRPPLYKWLVKKIVRQAKTLITVSHSLAQDMNKQVVKKPHTKISNVVNTDIFIFKEKPARSPFIFCHLSNMIPVKNVAGMLRACALLAEKNHDFELQLIGAQNKEHIALAKDLGIYDKHVFFKQAIAYEAVAGALQKAHALLMFSHTESQSCISLEALCTGTPVVSSKAGGIEEHLDDSNSILVARGNEKALAVAMEEMIKNYNRFKLSDIASKNQALWNFDVIGRQYSALIDDASFR